MKILYITLEAPRFPASGGQVRQFALIKHLASNHSVWLAVGCRTRDELDTVAAYCAQIAWAFPPKRPAPAWIKRIVRALLKDDADRVRQLFWHKPRMVQSTELIVSHLQAPLRAWLERYEFDLVVVAQSNLGYVIEQLATHVPKLLDMHDVLTELQRQRVRLARGLARWEALTELRKVERYERSVLARYDLLVACSEVDRQQLQSLAPGRQVAVVPNGVDTTYFRPADVQPTSNQLVFMGWFGHRPNYDAMIYFGRQIYPLLRRSVPDVRLTILGKDPPPEIQQLAQLPGVQVAGFVPDVRPYLAAAQVVIVPLRSGSGTRLKILDAMAMGKAIVTTTVGAEGVMVEDGKHVLIADAPQAFADAVERLLRDDGLRARLEHDGRRLVEQYYDWSVCAAKFERACESVVEQGKERR